MSRMLEEALAAPGCIAGQLASGEADLRALAGHLRAHPPAFAVTVARGSSDHAANFARYLFETSLGLVTASAAPSVVTIYGAKPAYRGALVVAISQSGESPDVVAVAAGARAEGAATVALVNAEASPLAEACEWTIGLAALRVDHRPRRR
jgi:glucosamine--fructose-6-phosphate aminotransferase (isomerizing)